jgi:carbon storage regulator CsrA
MLVLSRRDGERIEISKGGQLVCVIEVVRTKDGQVELGFKADQAVKILRDNAKTKEPK